jgi:PAS domain S-box-containing protein
MEGSVNQFIGSQGEYSTREFAAVMLDHSGRVATWNQAAENLTGYSYGEIIDQSISLFYPKEVSSLSVSDWGMRQAVHSSFYEEEGWCVRKDGSCFWAHVSLTPVLDESDNLDGFIHTIRHIAPREQAEEKIIKQNSSMKLLQEVAVAANEAADITSSFQFALDKICSFTGWMIGHVWIPDPEDREFLISAKIWRLDDEVRFNEFRRITEKYRFPYGTGLVGQVGESGKPAWVADVTLLPAYIRRQEAFSAGIKMGVVFPVISGEQVEALLEFYSTEAIEPDPPLLEVMTHIGSQLGRVIERSKQKQMAAELQEMHKRLMEAREFERVQLAQDLHEGVLQDLYSISYQVQAFYLSLPQDNHLSQEVTKIQSGLIDSVKKLRNFCRDLRPPTLLPFGLEKAIRSHVEEFMLHNPDIAVELELTDTPHPLPQLVRLALFRIYQEAMANIAKHSDANSVSIKLLVDAENILLEIKDDGKGFDVPNRWVEFARQGRLGLVNAYQRAETVGGNLMLESSPDRGTVLRVVVSTAGIDQD